uniref:Uncharacterized protein n=1 Tax=Anopheles maculatus TaxID=74869 RepID=A0A182SWP3_9DIPT
NDAQGGSTSTAKETNHEAKAQIEESNGEEIKVNVAALIATHQEKQQLSTLPPNAQISHKVAPTQHVEQQLETNPADPNDPASDEPVVSVSDKCQQFEQRIRQNSLDAGVCDATAQRKICHSDQPFQQQKPGTTHAIQQQIYYAVAKAVGVKKCAHGQHTLARDDTLLNRGEKKMVLPDDTDTDIVSINERKIGPQDRRGQ